MKIPQIGDIKKFSFAEMTSNDNGKTSGTSTLGVYTGFIGGLGFIMGTIDKMFLSKTPDVMLQSVNVLLIAAGLMGVKNIMNRRVGDGASDSTDTGQTVTQEQTTQVEVEEKTTETN